MVPLVLAAMFLGLVTTASGQRRGQPWPLGGYGNVVHPGKGQAPITPVGRAVWPNVFGRPVFAAQPNTATPGQSVILALPVYENSNLDQESGTYLPADGNPAQPSTNLDDRPPVVINQNLPSPPDDSRFANHYPAVGREFGPNPANSCASAVQGTSNTVANDGKPTIYLIAFKDQRIVKALGYWIEGTVLHYVSVEYALNQASITLIDPDLSRRLNHERGIKFEIIGPE
jgi:hypothetical protein